MERRAKPTTSRGVVAAAVVVVAALCAAFAGTNAAPVYHSTDSVPASVREVPQRPMTVKSDGGGGDADPFPISRGEPFVVDPANVPRNHGPITGFNVRPPGPRSAVPPPADEYAGYDYDATKLEEVPFDYQGDPIDRKDVHPEPGSARPNDIVKPVNKPQQQQSNSKLQTPTDIYQFLNLPKQYSSSDFKFPLVSSSYANTKVQGSGTSSSLSNHKMPDASTTTSAPTTTGSRYNPTVVKTTAKPATTRPPPSSTTSTTTTTAAAAPSQEYEEYDYSDYGYHPQEPALSPSTTTATAAATTATATTTTTTANPTTATAAAVAHREPSSYVTPEPAASITTDGAAASFTAAEATSTVQENAHRVPSTTTTFRPEIDSKLDGTSFSDYDAIKPPAVSGYGQPFKPLPNSYLQQQSYGGEDKTTYPLLTDGKTPMTFTAHVSSGISLNQKDQQRPATPEIGGDASGPSSAEQPPPPAAHPKPKPPSRPAADHRFEAAVHHHVVAPVRPDAYDAAPQQQFAAAAVQSRPSPNQPLQGNRPYPSQEPLAVKTTVAAPVRKPAPSQAYPAQSSAETHAKTKPLQYVPPPQTAVDTSKFKPPKHVINHFIKTLPDEDNKSYALQTSFSIGMDGERAGAETRPGQGVGQVLMVKDGSPAEAVDQPIPVKTKPSTASVPLVPPPRLAPKPQLQQQQQYPRPPWETAAQKLQPGYYPPPPQQPASPKRDGPQQPPPQPPPPAQRTSLPNILPQFRPNAKIDAPLVQPLHSATIERVQIPMDHLRPPPLPKPQFLKMDRNDENADEDQSGPDASEKETRTAATQRIGQPQPARVTTLQMIQHGAPGGAKTREDGVQEGPAAVHVVYAAGSPPARGTAEKTTADDSAMMLMDAKDRSDVPVLKTKTTSAAAAGKPAKTGGDFPYRIVRPEDVQNASSPPSLEYQAYSPTVPEAVSRPDVDHQQLVPNLQDYVPVSTRDTAPIGGFAAPAPQRPIAATLKTTAADEGQRGPQLQNFQIPFQPSMKLPENTNGWSVVRKSAVDGGASDRMDEAGDAAAASTEKFDPDNFKPHLVGGFVPIGSPLNDADEKKPTDRAERA